MDCVTCNVCGCAVYRMLRQREFGCIYSVLCGKIRPKLIQTPVLAAFKSGFWAWKSPGTRVWKGYWEHATIFIGRMICLASCMCAFMYVCTDQLFSQSAGCTGIWLHLSCLLWATQTISNMATCLTDSNRSSFDILLFWQVCSVEDNAWYYCWKIEMSYSAILCFNLYTIVRAGFHDALKISFQDWQFPTTNQTVLKSQSHSGLSPEYRIEVLFSD